MKKLSKYPSLVVLTFLCGLLLASCDGGPTDPEGLTETGPRLIAPYVHELTNGDIRMNVRPDPEPGDGVDLVHELGGISTPPAPHGLATAEVFADETGKTFWVSAEAPSVNGIDPDSTIGSVAGLRQNWKFRKESPNASLRFVISGTLLELLDDNSQPIDTREVCPWGYDSNSADMEQVCGSAQKTMIVAQYDASMFDSVKISDGSMMPGQVTFFRTSGWAAIEGFAEQQDPQISTGYQHEGDRPLFRLSDFDIEHPTGSQRHTQMRLRSPITIDVPLESVPLGENFIVGVFAEARAWTRRQGEVYIAAYFRDPASTGGLSVVHQGLELLDPSSDDSERITIIPPAPPCEATAGDGTGGTIQFEATSYFKPEWPGDAGDFAEIMVTRTGGTGEASALLTTGGGTATAGTRDTPGSDYEPVTTYIQFADGETGTQAVFVPIIGDTEIESDETVMLTLSDPGGCATVGGQTTATLTIGDDDEAGIYEAPTLGGTVTGLEGTGLRLRDSGRSVVEITSDGPFTFPANYSPGGIYNVTVDQQPDNPLQACTVTNGQGTVGNVDVTDILVTCVTPMADSWLDPNFGSGGIAKVDILPYSFDERFATALALQDDGKILAVGQNMLVRYNAAGTPDTGFGTGGEVAVDFGTGDERLFEVAVQPDGRILVTGIAVDNVNLPANNNFALARYETDGTLDTGFGNGGLAITDFHGRLDGANDILIQPDGTIVVTGYGDTVDQFGSTDPDFALARYTSTGKLDSTFGPDGNGKATVNIGGRLNGGNAAALQSDSKIVIVGTVAASRGSDPDIGIARFDQNGVLDLTFGTGGIVWTATPDDSDWALDVAVDANDRILVSGSWNADAFVARYEANGAPDGVFGGSGIVTDAVLWGANGIALDDLGRIVIVGTTGATPGDFGVGRFLGDGTLDIGFGDDGLVTIDYFGEFDEASDVLIQPDGKILVGGKIGEGNSQIVGLARVLP